mmetsp:Transcript_41961/g.125637  ORF Transcript_41961/g.125637 Transcript_41961/m.125637 type:complete len:207 (+) Transcript_41961:1616-2236(+)
MACDDCAAGRNRCREREDRVPRRQPRHRKLRDGRPSGQHRGQRRRRRPGLLVPRRELQRSCHSACRRRRKLHGCGQRGGSMPTRVEKDGRERSAIVAQSAPPCRQLHCQLLPLKAASNARGVKACVERAIAGHLCKPCDELAPAVLVNFKHQLHAAAPHRHRPHTPLALQRGHQQAAPCGQQVFWLAVLDLDRHAHLFGIEAGVVC